MTCLFGQIQWCKSFNGFLMDICYSSQKPQIAWSQPSFPRLSSSTQSLLPGSPNQSPFLKPAWYFHGPSPLLMPFSLHILEHFTRLPVKLLFEFLSDPTNQSSSPLHCAVWSWFCHPFSSPFSHHHCIFFIWDHLCASTCTLLRFVSLPLLRCYFAVFLLHCVFHGNNNMASIALIYSKFTKCQASF